MLSTLLALLTREILLAWDDVGRKRKAALHDDLRYDGLTDWACCLRTNYMINMSRGAERRFRDKMPYIESVRPLSERSRTI